MYFLSWENAFTHTSARRTGKVIWGSPGARRREYPFKPHGHLSACWGDAASNMRATRRLAQPDGKPGPLSDGWTGSIRGRSSSRSRYHPKHPCLDSTCTRRSVRKPCTLLHHSQRTVWMTSIAYRP